MTNNQPLRHIVSAKGDLIAATGSDDLDRVPVGANDTILVGDSAASTGVSYKSASTLGLKMPAGVIMDYAGSTAPTGWLLCYGQTVNRTTYAALFAILSTSFGAGDGSTTFGLPDLRGRFVAGIDNMGGSDAGRLSSSNTIGTAAGSENANNHTHLSGTYAMPSHSHGVGSYASQSHNHGPGTLSTSIDVTGSTVANSATQSGTGVNRANATHSHSIPALPVDQGQTASGGNNSITGVSANEGPILISGVSGDINTAVSGSNLPPYMVLNKIICTGI